MLLTVRGSVMDWNIELRSEKEGREISLNKRTNGSVNGWVNRWVINIEDIIEINQSAGFWTEPGAVI